MLIPQPKDLHELSLPPNTDVAMLALAQALRALVDHPKVGPKLSPPVNPATVKAP